MVNIAILGDGFSPPLSPMFGGGFVAIIGK